MGSRAACTQSIRDWDRVHQALTFVIHLHAPLIKPPVHCTLCKCNKNEKGWRFIRDPDVDP